MNTLIQKVCYTGIKLWYKRLKSKSPKFFVRIQNAAIIAASIWGLIVGADQCGFFAFMSAPAHQKFVVIITAIGTFMVGGGFWAKLPTTDPALASEDLKQAILDQAVANGTHSVVAPVPNTVL